ncbi:MAG TPA: lipase, partial [Dietzia sp.]|nr:lipase [Dietzia sp.]
MGVAVALAPATGPLGAPEAAAQGSSTAPDRTAFYVPPAELPADPGAIIRTQPMTITPSLPDVMNGGALPADAQRIMYRSTGAAGAPIAV